MITDRDPWKIQVHYDVGVDGYALYVSRGDEVVIGLQTAPIMKGERRAPMLDGSDGDGAMSFLRAALNAAWEMGLRPDGFDDTRESMKATNRHLEDMRSIAFGKLGVAKP